jgi:Mg-chelatase subunit ChlI
VLSTATGKSDLVDSLAHLWPLAERLAGRPCDPLDPALIERLSKDAGDG